MIARFADGHEERGDLLVAADGIRSAIRDQLLGPKEIRYAGFIVWRGITRFQHEAFPWGYMRQYVGRGRIFGMWHLTKGRVFWIASARMAAGGRRPRTAAITNEAWRIGQALHWRNPAACALRDLAFQSRPKRAWVKQQEKRLAAFQE